jgi:hypothetical protein
VYNPEVATPAASSAEEDKEAAMQAPLVFTFRLPPATDMEDLQPLMVRPQPLHQQHASST